MIDVGLFIKGKLIDRKMRNIVPRIGETIVIDCGEMVKVIEVSHDWDSPNFVQLQTIQIQVEEVEA